MPTQTASGKAFEYALAKRLAFELGSTVSGAPALKAQKHYENLSITDRNERDDAARDAVNFLLIRDQRLTSGQIDSIRMQLDQSAVKGDVRDIVILTNQGQEIGVSAKNRNTAIRNSRLSPTIDFGREWFESPCSDDYFADITPVFKMLEPYELSRSLWRELPDKSNDVYIPLLNAFMKETQRIFTNGDFQTPTRMMRYMLGKHDYYKVYKDNGNVIVESFNLTGSLQWGSKLAMPTRLVDLSMKPKSTTTVNMILDAGWQLSFRIHNATSRIERSLKFDVQIVGQPPSLSRHEIPYR